ncbi:MAG: dihydroorotase [Immundisolibacter sp.]|uniref:dihydroorotase n=1 Tax=Immundisolibacter sp. TaxID=1934948 RepID=UPI003EE24101
METLTLTRPDDCHLHLRDGPALAAVLGDTARRFARAVVMPNLSPPLTTVDAALAYRDRILEALPMGADFTPLMTLYLTEATSARQLTAAKAGGVVGVKLYPAGATTHSDAGVGRVEAVYSALETMQALDLPLLVHGEVTDPAVDVFDREAVFIDRHLAPLVARFPQLRVVLEHVTTREGVDFVRDARPGVAASITPQHLSMNRSALFEGGLRPHHYCLPILKREPHRAAVLEAAISGDARFFLGTDSAPHARGDKQSACGCAGIYSAHAGIEFYAEAFDQAGALDRLEAFAAHHGADFYLLPRNTGTLTLRRGAMAVPESLPFGDDRLIPLRAGGDVAWQVAD